MRSSGPGGQSVNTTNSKAQVRLNPSKIPYIDQRMKENIKNNNSKILNKDGQLVVTSQIHKSQSHNYQQCIQKLQKIIYESSLLKEQRRYDIPPQTQQQAKNRIHQKRMKSQVKSRRQNNKKNNFL